MVEVMKERGTNRHMFICAFVSKNTAKKMEFQMKIHKTASEQLCAGSSSWFFCILVNLLSIQLNHSLSADTHKTMNFNVTKNISNNRYDINYTVTNAIAK
jgi:hypothetical protein